MGKSYRNDFENYSFDFRLSKDWVFPYEMIDVGASIILYGAGDVGQSYMDQLSKNSFCKVISWVDNEYKKFREFGLNVESPSAIPTIDYDNVVIAVSSQRVALEINAVLLELGVSQKKIIWNDNGRFSFNGDLIEKRLIEPIEQNFKRAFPDSRMDYSTEEKNTIKDDLLETVRRPDGMVIPRLVVELTPACSLRCKGCNNLMPLYNKPEHFSYDNVICDINTVSSNVDTVEILELIGGEPFLYPAFADIVRAVKAIKNVLAVEITTNGTIVPKADVLNELKDSRITIRVSKYPGVYKREELLKTLDDHNIRYEVLEVAWTDSGGTERRNRSAEDIRNRYWRCPSAYNCKTLLKGKIFQCARAASLYDLGLDEGDVGYLDIYNTNNLKSEIKQFWLRTSDGACDHCDVVDWWRVISSGQ